MLINDAPEPTEYIVPDEQVLEIKNNAHFFAGFYRRFLRGIENLTPSEGVIRERNEATAKLIIADQELTNQSDDK